MPSVSAAQQRFFGGWEHNPEQMHGPKPKMTHEQMHDFAATSTKDLPDHVSKKPKRHFGGNPFAK
jgi:hypothetical protein